MQSVLDVQWFLKTLCMCSENVMQRERCGIVFCLVSIREKIFSCKNVQTWVDWNISLRFDILDGEWRVCFSILIKLIWQNRNFGVFERKTIGTTSLIAQTKEIMRWCSGEGGLMQQSGQNVSKWRPSFVGWMKFNVDGACGSVRRIAAGEGIARNCEGVVVIGFMFNVGVSDCLLAELWAVIWALKRAWELKWRR